MVIVRPQVKREAQALGLPGAVKAGGPAGSILHRQVGPAVGPVFKGSGTGPLDEDWPVTAPERQVGQAVGRVIGAPRRERVRGGERQAGLVNQDVPDLLSTGREPLVGLDPDGVPARTVGTILRHPGPADPQRPAGRQSPDGDHPGPARTHPTTSAGSRSHEDQFKR